MVFEGRLTDEDAEYIKLQLLAEKHKHWFYVTDTYKLQKAVNKLAEVFQPYKIEED